MIRRAAPLLALCLAWQAPAHAAAGTAERLAAAAEEIAEAGRGLEAARTAPDRVSALGRAVAAYEGALAALRGGVEEAGAREQALALGLEDRRSEIARLLAALEAISRTPPPAQALHPQGPLGAARAAAMMARLTPALEAEAAALAGELDALAAARELHAKGSADLAEGVGALNAARAELIAEVVKRGAEPEPVSPALTMLARDSETLTALAEALAEAGGEAPAPAGAEEPMRWPVRGTLLRHFREADAAGVHRPGILIEAPPLSLVSAPADAIVRYAGPFLDYGYVVVLEPEAGTMVVLAGLGQVQVQTGAAVRRGEPLGLLGARSPDVEEYVMIAETDAGAGASETLYIEVRQGQGPVDPEPLFAGEDG
jgi:septal ring factor EnvC (AmiA/AmiB activator)